jgi:hypothetical protein
LLVAVAAILAAAALEVLELALSSYLRFNRIRSLLVLVALQTSTAVILYFLPSHRQVAEVVRLAVRLTAVALVAAVRTAAALVALEIRLLHHQVKVTTAVLVAVQVAAAVAVLAQLAAMGLVRQVVQAAMARHQAYQAHR